jgi:hypothetical protein
MDLERLLGGEPPNLREALEDSLEGRSQLRRD